MIGLIRDTLLSAVFPRHCYLCERLAESSGDGYVCAECWASTRFFTGLETLCVKCGAYLSDAEPLFDVYCGDCDDAAFDAAFSLGPYRDGIRASILSLKTKPHAAQRLIDKAAGLYRERFEIKEMTIVPVPISAGKKLERGFNQAEIIADKLSRELGLGSDKHSLARTVDTKTHRAAMDRKAREASVKNAFVIKRKNLIEGKDILLIDDVFTSGATASECAEALKKGGASSVNVLTLGRAVLNY